MARREFLAAFLFVAWFCGNFFVTFGQVDNLNTLRYDGEVNIGKNFYRILLYRILLMRFRHFE